MIKLAKLQKNFGHLKALNEIELAIKPETITYIAGPNGSGKTTLIKAILGLVKPDAGEIFVDNIKLNGDCNYRSKIGYMPQAPSFPENLTVKEVFEMLKDIRAKHSDLDDQLVHSFGLEKEKNKRLKNLSGGTKQKVNAAIAFLFNPQILILDEPTSGLDPASSSILKDKIKEERAKGKTIILTSHILSELEELAENVILLIEGKVCFNGSLISLIDKTEKKNLERAIASLMSEAAA